MPKKKICHAHNRAYHPDYRKLYPDVVLSADVLKALNRSDRKMEYMEWELKHTRVRKNKAGEIISVTSAREDSLDRMQETGQFPTTTPSPEELFLRAEAQHELHRCLALLDERERALIRALFVDRLTEREYAREIGVSQPRVSQLWSRTRSKLKKLLQET